MTKLNKENRFKLEHYSKEWEQCDYCNIKYEHVHRKGTLPIDCERVYTVVSENLGCTTGSVGALINS